MFCTFCAIISPEWTHSCQGSGDWKVVATSGHLTLAAHPPTYVGFGRTGRTQRLQPTALSRRKSAVPRALRVVGERR